MSNEIDKMNIDKLNKLLSMAKDFVNCWIELFPELGKLQSTEYFMIASRDLENALEHCIHPDYTDVPPEDMAIESDPAYRLESARMLVRPILDALHQFQLNARFILS